jgi:predicted secreted acid phosphatase
MEKRCEEEVKKKDMKVIMDLDQEVMAQQVMLERAGVTGFFVTNNKQAIRLQMYLLEFINRHGGQFYWWRNRRTRRKPPDQVTDKRYNIMHQVHLV